MINVLLELSTLGSILLKVTLVLMAAWALHTFALRRSPLWRVYLWRATLAALLLVYT